MTRRRSATGGIAVAAMLALALPGSAAGGQNVFGAIAADRFTGEYGFAYDQTSRAAAELRALQGCQAVTPAADNCRSYVWVRNGCAALAGRHRANGSYSRIAWAIANSKRKARQRAVDAVGPPARVIAWTCTSGTPADRVELTGRYSSVTASTQTGTECEDASGFNEHSGFGLWSGSATCTEEPPSTAISTASQTSDVKAKLNGQDWLVDDTETDRTGVNGLTNSRLNAEFKVTGSVELSCSANTTGGEVLTRVTVAIDDRPELLIDINQGSTVGSALLDAGDHAVNVDTTNQDYLADPEADFDTYVTCDFDAPVSLGGS